MRFLHFSDNREERDRSDKMRKVRNIIDTLVNTFQELYQPSENISIDEGTFVTTLCHIVEKGSHLLTLCVGSY